MTESFDLAILVSALQERNLMPPVSSVETTGFGTDAGVRLNVLSEYDQKIESEILSCLGKVAHVELSWSQIDPHVDYIRT